MAVGFLLPRYDYLLIFNKSQKKFQDAAMLRRLIVNLIGNENWSVMGADVKGYAHEGLLEESRVV
ncbi:MAG: hypothetical protein QM483_08910 [Desulfuromusa sp.]